MKSELDVKLTVTCGIAVFLVLAALKGPKFSEEVVSVASSTLSLTVTARFVFIKWLWKWLPYGLHHVPLLEGTWEGSFESTGNVRTPEDRRRGKVRITILQPDLFSVRVFRVSEESVSSSFGEVLASTPVKTVELLYSYRSEPNALVRDRSPISYGTARLRGIELSLDRLEGDYWTDQKTTGVLKLSRQSG